MYKVVVILSLITVFFLYTSFTFNKEPQVELNNSQIKTLKEKEIDVNINPLTSAFGECSKNLKYTNSNTKFVSAFTYLNNLSNELDKKGLGFDVKKHIDFRTGLFSLFGNDNSYTNLHLLFNISKERFDSFSKEQELKRKVDLGDYGKIIEDIRNGYYKHNMLLVNNDKITSIFSYLITSRKSDFQELSIDLIDAGIELNYGDLLTMIEIKAPSSLLERMIEYSGISPDGIFYLDNSYSTLLLYSLRKKEYPLASYFLKLGSPAVINLIQENALDIIIFNEGTNQENYPSLFYTLVNEGLTRNIILLDSIVDKNFSDIEYLLLNRESLNVGNDFKYQFLIDRIYKEVLRSIVISDNGNLSSCLNFIGLAALQKLYRYKKNNPNFNSYSNQYKKTKEASHKGFINGDNYGRGGYIDGSAIAAKRLKEQERIERAKSYAQNNFDKTNSNEDKALVELFKKIYILAMENKWKEVFSLANEYDLKDQQFFSAIALIALSSNADVTVIEKLLSIGASLPDNSVYYLILNDNAKLAGELMEYGLDLNYVDVLGHSAINQAALYYANSMLKFLIEQGISVNSNQETLNALDVALQGIKNKPNDYSIVNILLKHGALIEPSHKDIVEEIRTESISSYLRLIERFPELTL